jgi:hypothetical protein
MGVIPAIGCGVMAGVGRGSMLPIHRRQRRPTTRWILDPGICQRKPPVGFMWISDAEAQYQTVTSGATK